MYFNLAVVLVFFALVALIVYGTLIVARIVRRLRPVKREGLTQLQNVYPSSEFIRSLDPLFRPVDVTTGPDGTIYIADMYRGMIEGAEWARAWGRFRQERGYSDYEEILKRPIPIVVLRSVTEGSARR